MFFLKISPFFLNSETSSWILTSNRSFWPEPIYWDINFVLKCLPAQCDLLASSIALQVTQPWLEIPLGVCRSLAEKCAELVNFTLSKIVFCCFMKIVDCDSNTWDGTGPQKGHIVGCMSAVICAKPGKWLIILHHFSYLIDLTIANNSHVSIIWGDLRCRSHVKIDS